MPKSKKAKKAIPASEFKDLPIWKELKGKRFKFKPFVFCNPDGDSIKVVWENGSFCDVLPRLKAGASRTTPGQQGA